MAKRFLEPLCKKIVQMFFYEEIWKMGKKYEEYDLTDAELNKIRADFEQFLEYQRYNKIEREKMRQEFEALCSFYRSKRDEINLPYA